VNGEMGSVIVVRADGSEKLTPLELEGICWYVSMVWRYIDEKRWCVDQGRISPTAFREFYDGFLKGRESVTGEEVKYSEARDADSLMSKGLITEMPIEMGNQVDAEMCIKYYNEVRDS